jgi:hypothetical protein
MPLRHPTFSTVAVLRRLVTRSSISSSPITPLTSRAAVFSPAFARMASTLPRLPIFEAIAAHDPGSTAVVHALSRRSFSYGELLGDVSRARDRLQEARGGAGLDGERIAFLVENSYDYVGEHTVTSKCPEPHRNPRSSPSRVRDDVFPPFQSVADGWP